MRCLDLYERETLGLYLQDQNQERRRSWLTKLLTWPSKIVVQFYGLTMSRLGKSCWRDVNKPVLESPVKTYLTTIPSGDKGIERRLGERFISTIMRAFIVGMWIGFVLGIILALSFSTK